MHVIDTVGEGAGAGRAEAGEGCVDIQSRPAT